ncbi:MAG: ferritin-like domain-containing protein, partial [Halieaceae bacterium]|nr:ferritin-like domain-containing protein [Halieaceae bacterium]
MANVANFTAPGMEKKSADKTIAILENRMVALIDLALTLKHVHWNVVGPNFIGVHEMLDPQVDAVREQ